jgi:hypothetical protein
VYVVLCLHPALHSPGRNKWLLHYLPEKIPHTNNFMIIIVLLSMTSFYSALICFVCLMSPVLWRNKPAFPTVNKHLRTFFTNAFPKKGNTNYQEYHNLSHYICIHFSLERTEHGIIISLLLSDRFWPYLKGSPNSSLNLSFN